MAYPNSAEEEQESVNAQAEYETQEGKAYYADLYGESISICRKMLKEELGIQTAFFDDAVRNAIIFVNVLAKGFKTLDVGGENMIIPEVLEAREALKLINPSRDRDTA